MKEIRQIYQEDEHQLPAYSNLWQRYKIPIVQQSRQNLLVLGTVFGIAILLPLSFILIDSKQLSYFLLVAALVITPFIAAFFFLAKRISEQIEIEVESEKLTIKSKDTTVIRFDDIANYVIEDEAFIRLTITLRNKQTIRLLANKFYCEIEPLQNFVRYFDKIMTHLIDTNKITAKRNASFISSKWALPVLIALSILMVTSVAIPIFYFKKHINAPLFSSFALLGALWVRYFTTRNKKNAH
ncbi:MAG: hypothetical protein JWO06_676 [Bacteroidota bacterium]|nr:hypothetical protein [Bacteroidota bacterium]